MNKHIVWGGIVVVIIGAVFVGSSLTTRPDGPVLNSENSMEKPDVTDTESMVQDSGSQQRSESRYIVYSPETAHTLIDKKRVLFFHATWCPTCKIADQQFSSKSDMIPEGVVVLKTDYDTNSDLKKKYGITYQHTFVQIDSEGNELAKWNGGGITELRENIQ